MVENKWLKVYHYEKEGFVLKHPGEPRSINYSSDAKCSIQINNNLYQFELSQNRPSYNLNIDGHSFLFEFGFPTKEIFINKIGYEFESFAPQLILLGSRQFQVRLDSAYIPIELGTTKNSKYIAGSVDMLVDNKVVATLALDSLEQNIHIDQKQIKVQFLDHFKTVCIEVVKYPVSF